MLEIRGLCSPGFKQIRSPAESVVTLVFKMVAAHHDDVSKLEGFLKKPGCHSWM
jgi:hypothetical protein